MPNLLETLIKELNSVFAAYEATHHIPTINNAKQIKQLKTIIDEAILAYELAQSLEAEIKKLETRFWGFLPGVADPIRDLKRELEKILINPTYQKNNAVITESKELLAENTDLKNRLQQLESAVNMLKKTSQTLPISDVSEHKQERPVLTDHETPVIEKNLKPSDKIFTDLMNMPDVQALELQLRTQIEQEVQGEISDLYQKLRDANKMNLQLKTENKTLEIKCEIYQKETHKAVSEKAKYEQDLLIAESQIAELTEENKRLKSRLESKMVTSYSTSYTPSKSTAAKDIPLNRFVKSNIYSKNSP